MEGNFEPWKSRLFVAQLPPAANTDNVRARFGQYGNVKLVNVLRGYGFVYFDNEASAKEAVQAEDGEEFLGSVLHVSIAKPSKMDLEAQRKLMTGGRPQPVRGQHGCGPRRAAPSPPPKDKPLCDCEIVCVSRESRRYCEEVEYKLKNLGMQADILFPNQDVALPKIMTNIQSRGVKFAVVITPANQESRTVSVTLLRSTPSTNAASGSEQRNVPLDEALRLLARAFESTLELEAKCGQVEPGETHPRDVASALGFLRDGRPLSVMELDKLIRYLALRREALLRSEYGDASVPAHLLALPLGPKQDATTRAREESLGRRVASLLAAPRPQSSRRASEDVPPVEETRDSGPPDLRRAIDSLFGGNLTDRFSSFT